MLLLFIDTDVLWSRPSDAVCTTVIYSPATRIAGVTVVTAQGIVIPGYPGVIDAHSKPAMLGRSEAYRRHRSLGRVLMGALSPRRLEFTSLTQVRENRQASLARAVKLVQGVKFTDGMEAVRQQPQATASP